MKMAQLPSIFGGAAVSLEEQAGGRSALLPHSLLRRTQVLNQLT